MSFPAERAAATCVIEHLCRRAGNPGPEPGGRSGAQVSGLCPCLPLVTPACVLLSRGTVSIAINGHGELCSVQKTGGCAVEPDALLRCIQLAYIRSGETLATIRAAVAESHRIEGVPPRRNLIAYLSSPHAK